MVKNKKNYFCKLDTLDTLLVFVWKQKVGVRRRQEGEGMRFILNKLGSGDDKVTDIHIWKNVLFYLEFTTEEFLAPREKFF